MDHAASTPLNKEVLKVMNSISNEYGNASSLHSFGIKAKTLLEESREKIASIIGAGKQEIIFTSGGTEAENLAIKGIASANKEKGNHIITSGIEHPATLESCRFLEKNGFEVTYLKVDKEGLVNLEDLKKAITKKTILIAVMHANHEIGTIQPIREIGKIAHENKIHFHSNIIQSIGKLQIDVNGLNIDSTSISSHKIYGPKGIGALFLKENAKIEPQMVGGYQESGVRAGTENITAIAGFAKALEVAEKIRIKEAERLTKLRDYLIKNALAIEKSWLNGSLKHRLPDNINLGFAYIEGESLVLILDMKGIAASTGSACSSATLKPSHILKALGLTHEQCHGSLRLTLGRSNTKKDVQYLMEILPNAVEELRRISPLTKV